MEERKLQKRTESWSIKTWNVKQIQNKLSGLFRRKEIAIIEIHVTPEILEFSYYENYPPQINPSKRY